MKNRIPFLSFERVKKLSDENGGDLVTPVDDDDVTIVWKDGKLRFIRLKGIVDKVVEEGPSNGGKTYWEVKEW